MRCPLSLTLAAGLSVLLSAEVQAQFSSSGTSNRGTTTSGMFGNTTIGGSSALGSSANSGITMGAGTTAMGMGMGSTGMGGTGQGTSGMSMGVPTMTQSNFIGASSQNSGNFRSLQGAQGGQGAQGMNGMQQGMGGMQGIGGRGGAGGISGLRNSLSQQNRQNGFNAQQAQRSRQGGTQGQNQIRIPLRLGFQPTAVVAPRFNASFSDRLAKMPSLQRIGSINVVLEGRTAILRGTVASEADRQLAASLARLEPEVLAVQNELVVGSAETTGEILPPASSAAAQ